MNRFDLFKSKIFLTVIIFVLSVSIFTGCSFNEKPQDEITVSVQAPEMPLKPWNNEYLFENIPAPENTHVYEFSNGTAYGWDYYGYKFENFTLEQAREYISLLESAGVSVKVYDEYYKNDYPIFNYLGYTEDGVQVTVTQCHTSGICGINIRSEKQ